MTTTAFDAIARTRKIAIGKIQEIARCVIRAPAMVITVDGEGVICEAVVITEAIRLELR